MKKCQICNNFVDDNIQTCPFCDNDSFEPITLDDNINTNDNKTIKILTVVSLVLTCISPITILLGYEAGVAGPLMGVVLCIISVIMAVNAFNMDKSKSWPKVSIGLGIGFLVLNLVLAIACVSLCGGKSGRSHYDSCYNACAGESCVMDGTQCNPLYNK